MNEEYLQSIILGIVQGIAEFLPISSSGHLVIIGELFFPDVTAAEQKIDLNIALHVGSLFSILLVYRRILWQTLMDWKMVSGIIIATIPIVIVGLTLKDQIEASFNSPLIAGCGLLMTAMFLSLSQYLSLRFHKQELKQEVDEAPPANRDRDFRAPDWWQALVVGLFQAVAITPGISRSGSTISGALITGMQKLDAARFSFLIAIPAIAGATLLKAKDMLEMDQSQTTTIPVGALLTGMLVSFVVGYFSLTALIQLIARGRLYWFAIYCLCAGLLTIGWQLLKA